MLFENYRIKRDIKKADLEYQKMALKYVSKNMKFLSEATNVVEPEEASDWTKSGSGSDSGDRPTEEEHLTMLEQAFKLWRRNLHARAIIRTMVKFVIGKGATIRPKDENKKVMEAWKDFGREGADLNVTPAVRNRWNHREKELFNRLFRDGEVIMRIFRGGERGKGLVKIRFIRADRIRTPTGLKADSKTGLYKDMRVSYGIGHNPDDVEDYKTYFLCNTDGTLLEEIPASDILHYKVFADSDMKRGISLLEVCAPRLADHDGWLKDRIVLNKIRNAIALIRTVEGPTGLVQSIRDNLETKTRDADRKKMKMLERGTVITASPGIKYEMLSPNVQAADVAEDGRAMLLSIAAGVGFPEMILTADYSNANYSSTLIAQNPFVREIEDWQDFAESIYYDLFAIVIANKIKYGGLPNSTSLECDVVFQPLIHQDMKKEDDAFSIEYDKGVLSRKTWQLKRGLDPETEKANREDEMGDDAYMTPPGTPPGTPVPEEPEEEEEGDLRDIT